MHILGRTGQSLRLAGALALLPALAAAAVALPTAAAAQSAVSVQVAPPPMPYLQQPPIPAPNAIWAPGYWAWDDWWGDFYWVPGTWVQPPHAGLLWTPGWWGYAAGRYLWHAGYWAPKVGWYGGINYGYGYNGRGYDGGEWRGGRFFYNNAVTNVRGSGTTNVYSRRVALGPHTFINNTRVSYAGGPGGAVGQPLAAFRGPHIAPVAGQMATERNAQANRDAFSSVNMGHPKVTALARPGAMPNGPAHPADITRPGPGGGAPAQALRDAMPSIQNAAPGGPAHSPPAPLPPELHPTTAGGAHHRHHRD